MKRRQLLGKGFAVATASVLASTFPELPALAKGSSRSTLPYWLDEDIPYSSLVDVTKKFSVPEIKRLTGLDTVSYHTVSLGRLKDGTLVRRFAAAKTSHIGSTVFQHLSKDGKIVLESVHRNVEISNDGKELKATLVGQLPVIESRSQVASGPCPGIGSVPSYQCVAVDSGFWDCCAACIWAGPAWAICALAWCGACLIEHCTKRILVCS